MRLVAVLIVIIGAVSLSSIEKNDIVENIVKILQLQEEIKDGTSVQFALGVAIGVKLLEGSDWERNREKRFWILNQLYGILDQFHEVADKDCK